ncbi:MAG: STAS/SEC14 domain-containing protein [Patescibacteria group bacterium]
MADEQKQPGTKSLKQNEITLERDGIMRMYYRGPQTAEGIRALGEKGDEFAEQLQEKGEPVVIMVDVGELGTFGQPEIQAWRRLMATRDYERMAIVRLNPALQVVMHFLVKMSNRKDKVEAFEDESEAVDWLREATTNR